MTEFEKQKLCKEAMALLDKIEGNLVFIVESIKANKLKKAA